MARNGNTLEHLVSHLGNETEIFCQVKAGQKRRRVSGPKVRASTGKMQQRVLWIRHLTLERMQKLVGKVSIDMRTWPALQPISLVYCPSWRLPGSRHSEVKAGAVFCRFVSWSSFTRRLQSSLRSYILPDRRLRSSGIKPAQLKPAQPSSTQLKPAQTSSTQLKPAQPNIQHQQCAWIAAAGLSTVQHILLQHRSKTSTSSSITITASTRTTEQ